MTCSKAALSVLDNYCGVIRLFFGKLLPQNKVAFENCNSTRIGAPTTPGQKNFRFDC